MMTRRTFLKTAAAAVAVASLSGVLPGCAPVKEALAIGIDSTADLAGIRVTVTQLGTVNDSVNHCFYIVPTLEVENYAAERAVVQPLDGSFDIFLPDGTALTLDESTMARLDAFPEEYTSLTAQDVPRRKTAKGTLCARGTGVSQAAYIDVVYYPDLADKTIRMHCQINQNQYTQLLMI